MSSTMGADWAGGEGCDDGILKIWKFDKWLGTWAGEVDMKKWFIPKDISNSGDMKGIPLITVWELDDHYQPTECKLVETVDEGVIVIRQPKDKYCVAWGGSGCLQWAQAWDCLKLDSHDWKSPWRDERIGQYDCHCFEQ